MRAIVSTRGMIDSRGQLFDAVDPRLVTFLLKNKIEPFFIPNNSKLIEFYFKKIKPQIIILSGGDDLGSYPKRDEIEFELLNIAIKNSLKVFGICRGTQVMAIHQGGRVETVPGHAAVVHEVKGIYNFNVTSYHNFCINESPNFTILARAQDGTIEAITHSFLPWEGWMWHPEREMGNFDNLFVEAIQKL